MKHPQRRVHVTSSVDIAVDDDSRSVEEDVLRPVREPQHAPTLHCCAAVIRFIMTTCGAIKVHLLVLVLRAYKTNGHRFDDMRPEIRVIPCELRGGTTAVGGAGKKTCVSELQLLATSDELIKSRCSR